MCRGKTPTIKPHEDENKKKNSHKTVVDLEDKAKGSIEEACFLTCSHSTQWRRPGDRSKEEA